MTITTLFPEIESWRLDFDPRRGPRAPHEYQVGVSGHTPIPTSAGLRLAGEVFPGDYILNAEGLPTLVTEVIQQPADSYIEFYFKTGFLDLGRNQRVDCRPYHASATRPWSALHLSQDERTFLVPVPVPLNLPDRSLPVPPYLLGLWLGDGSTGQPNITVGDQDLHETMAQLEVRGVETHLLRSTPGKAHRIGFSNRKGFSQEMGTGVAKALRSLPCYRDKHIPDEYLWAGDDQRLELLKGLMDSDGCCSQSGYNIFSGTEDLCRQVQTLLTALGQYATVAIQTDPRARAGFTAVTRFQSLHGLVPYSHPRKAERVTPSSRKNHRYDWAASVNAPTTLFAFVTQGDADYVVGDCGVVIKGPREFTQSRHYS